MGNGCWYTCVYDGTGSCKPSSHNQRTDVSRQHEEWGSPRWTSTTSSFTATVTISPKMFSLVFCHLPFVLGNVPMDDEDNRVVMLEEGRMTCKVCEKAFQANNHKIRIAITMVYHNGNVKVILVPLTNQRWLTMDFVTMTEKIGGL